MIIVGGSYREQCVYPQWDRIYGSGGRAAVAVSGLSPGSSLYTYACTQWAADVRATMEAVGIHAHVTEIDDDLVFRYYYPLSKDHVPEPTRRQQPIEVTGEVVLSFGMLEGSATVNADRAVHDPQSSNQSAAFSNSGSQARQLAYVVRDYMLTSGRPGEDPMDAVAGIMQDEGATIVVARHAAGGASVYIGETRPKRVPAYLSDTWFKIGSGDVFCAAFAHYWGERRMDPVMAADVASRSEAYFTDGHRLPLPAVDDLAALVSHPNGVASAPVFLTGPSTTLSQRWILDEAYAKLQELGHDVVSPFHRYGATLNRQAERAAAEMAACTAVLAFVDGGDPVTSFHVGRARAMSLKVILLAEAVREADLTMFAGTECDVARDLATAIYRAHFASLRLHGTAKP